MKNFLAIVAMTAALSGLSLAQAKPNFSGKWTETGVAAGELAQALIVQQDATMITVETSSANRWIFKLDGTESKNVTPETGKVSMSTAKWDGDKLAISTPGRSNGDGPFMVTSTWSLNDGKLVVKETVITQAGSILRDHTRTYTR